MPDGAHHCDYPHAAIWDGEGSAIVEFTIATDGTVKEPQIIWKQR